MVAGRRQVVEEPLNARLVGDRLARVRSAGGRLGLIPAPQPVDVIHLLGSCVIRLQLFVGNRPGRGDAVVMAERAEILPSEAIQGGAEQLGGAANEITRVRLKRAA